MNALYAVIFTILRRVIRLQGSPRILPSRNYLTVGFALSAELQRKTSEKSESIVRAIIEKVTIKNVRMFISILRVSSIVNLPLFLCPLHVIFGDITH
jgi:hypothetical protein